MQVQVQVFFYMWKINIRNIFVIKKSTQGDLALLAVEKKLQLSNNFHVAK
jgi:hypothetical protein